MMAPVIQVNPREDGRFELVIDGIVVRCTFDEEEIAERVRALAGRSTNPDQRDQMLGRAIGRSH